MAIKYADGSDSDGGRVIQVQFTNFGTQYTNTTNPALSNSSFQPTGLSCAITPKSTSSKTVSYTHLTLPTNRCV